MPLGRDSLITVGAALSALGVGVLVAFAWFPQIHLYLGLTGWIIGGVGMGLTMPSSAVAVMSLSTQFEQGRNQSSMLVAEAVGNWVVTAFAGGLYTALLFVEPSRMSFSVALGASLLFSLAAVVASRRIGPIESVLAVRA